MSANPTRVDIDIARRPEIERLLDKYSVSWRFESDLPISRIDEKASLGNQARIDQPLMPDLLEQYIVARNHGDEFPAIVVNEPRPDRQVVVVDGNHRFASAKETGLGNHPAYVIKAKPETLRVLMTELNVINGRPMSDKERLYHAFFLIDQGTSLDSAAATMRLPASRVRTAWALESANRRARELGVKSRGWNDLPQGTRIRIGQVYTDEAFRELVGLVVKADLTGTEVSKLVTDIGKSRSSKAQLDKITEEAKFRQDQIQGTASGKIPFRQNPKNALRMHLGALTKLNIQDIPALCSAEEGDVLAQICMDASAVLEQLADRLTATK